MLRDPFGQRTLQYHSAVLRATNERKGKTHLDEDTTYMYNKLSFSGTLLQDGIDHVVFLLFGNTRRRRGRDVEGHA